jgi:hypothetical protein
MSDPQGAKIEKVGGASLSYARPPVAPYGTRGNIRPFWCEREFVRIVDDAFSDLWRLCPLGPAEVVASAGFFVDKAGEHATGRAMDVDAIFWPGHDFVTNNFATDTPLYFAVEAVLRRHFGVVLDFTYNAAHHDHFHVDCSEQVGFRKVGSIAGFLKASARRVLGTQVNERPSWDADADKAAAALKAFCSFSGNWDSVDEWKAFLEAFATLLFHPAELKSGGAATELQSLVQGVYATIAAETGVDTAARKKIESAVAGLVMHPDIHGVIYSK